jgi:hypothetical protein
VVAVRLEDPLEAIMVGGWLGPVRYRRQIPKDSKQSFHHHQTGSAPGRIGRICRRTGHCFHELIEGDRDRGRTHPGSESLSLSLLFFSPRPHVRRSVLDEMDGRFAVGRHQGGRFPAPAPLTRRRCRDRTAWGSPTPTLPNQRPAGWAGQPSETRTLALHLQSAPPLPFLLQFPLEHLLGYVSHPNA